MIKLHLNGMKGIILMRFVGMMQLQMRLKIQYQTGGLIEKYQGHQGAEIL